MSSNPGLRLAVLNSMAGADIEASLEEMTPSPARVHPDAPDTTSSPGQMKTHHLLRHTQRALARVIGELTAQGIGYTGPEQTDERRISGSENRSCLGCRRTDQPFMQGRQPADDQQHRRAERRLGDRCVRGDFSREA